MMAVLLDGLAFGLQLSMLAVGLTLVFGLGGVLNLAHGQLVAVAAIIAASALGAGLGVWPALVLAVTTSGALAWVLDTALLRPVYRLEGEARALLSLLVTLGVAFTIDGLLITYHPFTMLNLVVASPSIDVFGVTMRRGSVLASLVAVLVLGALAAFLRFTLAGRAVRSVIEDEEGARLCGIDPVRIRTRIAVTAGVLAGIVAATRGLTTPVGASSGFDLTILALVVTVVGGLGRVTGALVAGIVLGLVHAATATYVGASPASVILLLVAVGTILVRPRGILTSSRG